MWAEERRRVSVAPMDFSDVVETVGKSVDGLGVAITVIGVLLALGAAGVALLRGDPPDDAYRDVRRRIGRAVLLGLEVLVAGDIIRTVAVQPSFRTVGVLAVIVAVRTFLSMTLEVEISARWPWQKPSATASVEST